MKHKIQELLTEWFKCNNPEVQSVEITKFYITDEAILNVETRVITFDEQHKIQHDLVMQIEEGSIFPEEPAKYPQILLWTNRPEDKKWVGEPFDYDCWYPEPSFRGKQKERARIIKELNEIAFELVLQILKKFKLKSRQ